VITVAPIAVVVLIVALLAVIVVRSDQSIASPVAIAAPAPLVSGACPADYGIYGIPRPESSTGARETDPPTGSIPAGFVPVRFRLCVIDGAASARLKGKTVVDERIGDVTPELIAALSRPDAQGDPYCPTYSVTTTLFFLVDAAGNTIRPHLPEALCGQTNADVLALIHHLPYRQTAMTIQGPPG